MEQLKRAILENVGNMLTIEYGTPERKRTFVGAPQMPLDNQRSIRWKRTNGSVWTYKRWVRIYGVKKDNTTLFQDSRGITLGTLINSLKGNPVYEANREIFLTPPIRDIIDKLESRGL